MNWLTDLTPFASDRCWQFVLLARKAPMGLVIRRGPSKWWHLTLWDTRQDRFTSGQWLSSFRLRRQTLEPRRLPHVDRGFPAPIFHRAGTMRTRSWRGSKHWTDFDQRGRLVAAGGRILEGKFDGARRW